MTLPQKLKAKPLSHLKYIQGKRQKAKIKENCKIVADYRWHIKFIWIKVLFQRKPETETSGCHTYLQFETMQETKCHQSSFLRREKNSSSECHGQHRSFMTRQVNINLYAGHHSIRIWAHLNFALHYGLNYVTNYCLLHCTCIQIITRLVDYQKNTL